jgi:DNA invertase Pin-like site-specific DNA recombinase
MEGRGLAKGNSDQQNALRTQSRTGAPSALDRVREVAEKDKTVRFTTLLHHIYAPEALKAAYCALKREAAPGVDGETWRHYGEALEENLADLSGRLARGAYRAKPVKRASTARQYGLAGEARRLGWEASRIVVIDDDLGISGRTASARAGYRELVGRVCLGEVGAILGLEVSRLARSSADLQRLLEFCSVSDTVIIDSDGTYDLTNFNDRLLLGLKGTMSEAELHLLAGRLHGAKQAAAGRGALRFPLPVGYVYDDARATVMDPDEEIQAAVRDLFAAFAALGSAYGVVGAFAERRFPRRAYGGAWAGEIRWGRLTHGRVLSVLANPAYAGAYVFGRYRSRRTLTPEGTIRTKLINLPLPEWAVLIHDHHPGYISWETYLANRERVAAHCTHHGARPEREGSALCQGIVRCGACGRGMATTYPAGKPAYDCSRTRADHTKTPGCRSVLAAVIDGVVTQRLLQVVAPEEIALALAAADEVADRHARSRRALELRAERARYEAARAERAFHHCDPDNRLVARSLEPRWEAQLKELAEGSGSAPVTRERVQCRRGRRSKRLRGICPGSGPLPRRRRRIASVWCARWSQTSPWCPNPPARGWGSGSDGARGPRRRWSHIGGSRRPSLGAPLPTSWNS